MAMTLSDMERRRQSLAQYDPNWRSRLKVVGYESTEPANSGPIYDEASRLLIAQMEPLEREFNQLAPGFSVPGGTFAGRKYMGPSLGGVAPYDEAAMGRNAQALATYGTIDIPDPDRPGEVVSFRYQGQPLSGSTYQGVLNPTGPVFQGVAIQQRDGTMVQGPLPGASPAPAPGTTPVPTTPTPAQQAAQLALRVGQRQSYTGEDEFQAQRPAMTATGTGTLPTGFTATGAPAAATRALGTLPQTAAMTRPPILGTAPPGAASPGAIGTAPPVTPQLDRLSNPAQPMSLGEQYGAQALKGQGTYGGIGTSNITPYTPAGDRMSSGGMWDYTKDGQFVTSPNDPALAKTGSPENMAKTAAALAALKSGDYQGATAKTGDVLGRMGMSPANVALQAPENVDALRTGRDALNMNTLGADGKLGGQWFGLTPDRTIPLGLNDKLPANAGLKAASSPAASALMDRSARANIFQGATGGQAVNSDPYNGQPLGIPGTPEAQAIVKPDVLARLTQEAAARKAQADAATAPAGPGPGFLGGFLNRAAASGPAAAPATPSPQADDIRRRAAGIYDASRAGAAIPSPGTPNPAPGASAPSGPPVAQIPASGTAEAPPPPVVMAEPYQAPAYNLQNVRFNAPPLQGIPTIQPQGSEPFATTLPASRDIMAELAPALGLRFQDPQALSRYIDQIMGLLDPITQAELAQAKTEYDEILRQLTGRFAARGTLYGGSRQNAEIEVASKLAQANLGARARQAERVISNLIPMADLALKEQSQQATQGVQRAGVAAQANTQDLTRATTTADLAKAGQSYRTEETERPLRLAQAGANVEATRTRTARDQMDAQRTAALAQDEQKLSQLKIRAAELQDEMDRAPDTGARARAQLALRQTNIELEKLQAGVDQTRAATEQTRLATERTRTLLPGEVAQQGAQTAGTLAGTARTQAETARYTQLTPGEVQKQKIDNAAKELERKAANDALFQKNDLYPLQRRLTELKVEAEKLAADIAKDPAYGATAEAKQRAAKIDAEIERIRADTGATQALAAQRAAGGGTGSPATNPGLGFDVPAPVAVSGGGPAPSGGDDSGMADNAPYTGTTYSLRVPPSQQKLSATQAREREERYVYGVVAQMYQDGKTKDQVDQYIRQSSAQMQTVDTATALKYSEQAANYQKPVTTPATVQKTKALNDLQVLSGEYKAANVGLGQAIQATAKDIQENQQEWGGTSIQDAVRSILRGYGIDPDTLQGATAGQIAELEALGIVKRRNPPGGGGFNFGDMP